MEENQTSGAVMERESLRSTICTGSHMNRRSFNPEDPWLSLESTILAGNVSGAEAESSRSSSKHQELSTVSEEKVSTFPSMEFELEAIVDDNVLNMNIDAISDDEVFFDCSTSPCPTPKKMFKSPIVKKSPRPRMPLNAAPTSQFGQFLTVEDYVMTGSSSTGTWDNSGSVQADDRTGGLLVQVMDAFNDVKDHAQSTPKLEEDTDSGYFQLPDNSVGKCSSKSLAAKQRPVAPPRKKLTSATRKLSPTYKTMSTVNSSDKENYFRGRYSRAVAAGKSTSPSIRPRQVAKIKEFFESRIMSESQPSQKPPRIVAQTSSICHKTTLRKSPKVSDLSSINSNEASRKKPAKARTSSCSEISSTESSVSRVSTNRSKSTSDSNTDATTDVSSERMAIQRVNNVVIRRYNINNQRTKSPTYPTKKRRSTGLIVSPIKPVRETRKKFSPRYQGKNS